MNRAITIALGGLLSLAMMGGWTAAASAPAGYKAYTSAKAHYCLYYPASWRVSYPEPQLTLVGPKVHGQFTAVVVQDLKTGNLNVSVDQLAAAAARDMKRGGKVFGESKLRVGGADARMIAGQNKSGSSSVKKTAEVVFLSHGRFWTIVYTADPAGYGASYGKFKTLLSSFTFTS